MRAGLRIVVSNLYGDVVFEYVQRIAVRDTMARGSGAWLSWEGVECPTLALKFGVNRAGFFRDKFCRVE